MTALDQFRDAAMGWYALALNRPEWRGRFVTTPAGLLVALAGYFTIVVLAILVQGLTMGAPGVLELLAGVLINALPLVAIAVALVLTRLILKVTVPLLDMLVPAIHLVSGLLIAGFALALLGDTLAVVLLGLVGYLLYRGGREILGLSLGSALAYAGLSIVLLVGLPASLYMLLAPGPGGPI